VSAPFVAPGRERGRRPIRFAAFGLAMVLVFSLLIAISVGSLVGTAFRRIRILSPVIATFVASLVYSMILLNVTALLTSVRVPDAATAAVIPTAVYDAGLALVVGPLAMAIVTRRRDAERADW
jgi:hypothetical protein